MFRRVLLPGSVPGKLLLHSMPGRHEALERVWEQLRQHSVDAIVCLAEMDEIRQSSREYAEALQAGEVPCPVRHFEIPDRGAPADRNGFWTLALEIAGRLEAGDAILIHCAGGVGRTATLAIPVMLALGEPAESARRVVSRAGSTVETASQSGMVLWCADRLGGRV